MKKKSTLLSLSIVAFAIVVWLNNTSLFYASDGKHRILAHRGLAQTFDVSRVHWDTNTAEIIYEPEHGYLENTIPSMEAAFKHGADVVEFDVKLTSDERLAVFHDFTLEYRTDFKGSVNQYTMAELKQADIGYGYTADGGKTFPFRGKGVGLMPGIEEVFAAFPDKEFLIHIKDNDIKTARVLWRYLTQMPEDPFARITVYGDDEPVKHLRSRSDSMRLLSRDMLKSGFIKYVLLGWFGYVPKEWDHAQLHLPPKYAKFLWGWPHKFVDRMNRVNTRVVLIAGDGKWSEGFDTLESLEQIPPGYQGYVWTNRVDRITGASAGQAR